jgi:hypothetical protein
MNPQQQQQQQQQHQMNVLAAAQARAMGTPSMAMMSPMIPGGQTPHMGKAIISPPT